MRAYARFFIIYKVNTFDKKILLKFLIFSIDFVKKGTNISIQEGRKCAFVPGMTLKG